MGVKTTTTQTGKKGRKFGRNSRGHSMATYKAVRRDLVNKSRRMEKHDKAMKQAAEKKATMVPHGTARALRRSNMVKFRAERLAAQVAERQARSRLAV